MKKENEKSMHTARPIVLVLAILCFLLPLFNIKCSSPGGDFQIASVSGTSLLTGGRISANKEFEEQLKGKSKDLFKTDKNNEVQEDNNEETETAVNDKPTVNTKESDSDTNLKVNWFAVASLLFIIAALVLCFVKIKKQSLYILAASGLAILSLIVLAVNMKSYLDLKKGSKSNGMDVDFGMIKVAPSIGYYLLILLVLSAAIISYLFYKKENNELYNTNLEKELLSTTQDNTPTNVGETNE